MNGWRSEVRDRKSESNLNLHIEELVLHGFLPGDGHRIAAALEQELARLFSEASLPVNLQKNISLDRIDGGSFPLSNDMRPARVGEQIAGAIHGGLGL